VFIYYFYFIFLFFISQNGGTHTVPPCAGFCGLGLGGMGGSALFDAYYVLRSQPLAPHRFPSKLRLVESRYRFQIIHLLWQKNLLCLKNLERPGNMGRASPLILPK
jgi:hypothetical protein